MKMNMKPSHPGEMLREAVLKPMGLSVTRAAQQLGISRKTLSSLINERVRLTPDLAMRIAIATGTTVESWINLQAQLDAWEVDHDRPKNVSKFKQENQATM